jgi:diguanylate cyclase (GGDEF)-like protein
LEDRDVISTYVPIYAQQPGQDRVEGVFEVYLDVTTFVQTADEKLKWVSIMVLAVLGGLYLTQLVVVRRAQSILRRQEIALQDANRELDQRVSERTRELQAEVAERRHAEQRLDHLAHHDPLTNLPNRLLFRQRLTQSLDDLPRHNHQIAVLIIGLDHFKEVNETLGHVIGDELLVVIALRLQACLEPTDLLARMGGDEFSCILQGIHAPLDAATQAEALLELFKRPFIVGENLLYLSASIGISLAPQDDHEVAKLVRNAHAAMYQAKARGRNRSHFYTPEITTTAQDRLRLADLLRKAISADELRVHFQPKVNPENGQLCGAEALVRWTQLEMGPVPLARFIPLAEEIGFIIELGAWVLRETCLQIMAWDAEGLHVPRVSVNVSVKQLERGNLVQTLRNILAETGLDPHRLELEITESVIMAVDDAITVLVELRALGVQLSIDDFGTGYSSLSYLKKLPIQTLKIDRAFVMGIGENKSDESIIQAILEISKSLGLHTVAEGVETKEQLDFLRAMGCHQIQGFFYGEAIEQHDFFTRWEPHQARLPLSDKHLQAV